MLTAAADWDTEHVIVDGVRGTQILAVSGQFWSCSPEALCRSLARYVGIDPNDVLPGPDMLVLIAPIGTFVEPFDYRAWVDEAVSEAERESAATTQLAPDAARVAAQNIASLAAEVGLTTDAIMRAAMVLPETAQAIIGGRALPAADLVRIATALGVTPERLKTPARDPSRTPRR